MLSNDLRNAFIKYFEQNDHTKIASSPVIPKNDDSILFTNSGMIQFKNMFCGIEDPIFKNAVSYQKCIRAGGKHNDLDNVGFTTRHHTFFEMLGNFSFGGYFKEKAIYLAYKFITKTLAINKNKLVFTVYEDDEEAYNLWKKIANTNKIIKVKTADNFWQMADTGPCGPCSEIFYDHGEHLSGDIYDGDRFVEIWNLVFMQYNMDANGTKHPLKRKCIDTGMGLERTCAILQGKHDNFETDLFADLIIAIREIFKLKNKILSPSMKVIIDHVRSACFLISENIIPGNEGRSYVLRRIIRRSLRHAYLLGIKEPILFKLVNILINKMSAAYPELLTKKSVIEKILKTEEEKFIITLHDGLSILSKSVPKNSKIIDGKLAFKLYDTYGFPLDLTENIAKENNMKVDKKEFENQMKIQKQKSQWKQKDTNNFDQIWFQIENSHGRTKFEGYKNIQTTSKVLAIVDENGNIINKTQSNDSNTGNMAFVVFDKTPFYATGGGQLSDTGNIKTSTNSVIGQIIEVEKKANNLFIHKIEIETGTIENGKEYKIEIDCEKRQDTCKNHSATHLLHAALKKVLGNYITQQGSMLDHLKLRFDFNHEKPLTDEEIEKIEWEVNKAITSSHNVSEDMKNHDAALKEGAIGIFTNKYGEKVRIISMGKSMELCGGTHVDNTAEIGYFMITKQQSVSSGIRRIEAVTGRIAYQMMNEKRKIIKDITKQLNCTEDQIIEKIQEKQSDKKIDPKPEMILEKKSEKTHIKIFTPIEKNILRSKIDNIEKNLIIVIGYNDKTKMADIFIKSRTEDYDAREILKKFQKTMEIKGGGKKDLVQGFIKNIYGIDQLIKNIEESI